MSSIANLNALTVVALRKELKKYGLSTIGKKSILIKRLSNYLQTLSSSSSSDDNNHSSSEDEFEQALGQLQKLSKKKLLTDSKKRKNKTIQWFWRGDSGGGSQNCWVPYDLSTNCELERAFQCWQLKKKHKRTLTKNDYRLGVDPQRFVNFSHDPMVQARFDDESRMRAVKRGFTNDYISSSESSNSGFSASSSSSSDDSSDSDMEDEVVWFWAGDSPATKSNPQGGHQDMWVEYSATLQRKLEDAWNNNKKKLKVDRERFVDFVNMLQRRYDDPMRRRMVKRGTKKVKKTAAAASSSSTTTTTTTTTTSSRASTRASALRRGTKRKLKQVQQSLSSSSSSDDDDSSDDTTSTTTSTTSTNKPKKKKQKTAASSTSAVSFSMHFPSTWTPMNAMGIEEVQVPKYSNEFSSMQKMLTSTIAGYHRNATWIHKVPFTDLQLTKLVRIQNPMLWMRYQTRKEHLQEELSAANYKKKLSKVLTGKATDASVNEFFLFHGLNASYIPGICKFGFDPRYCSLEGMFGAAIYFAENSSKSNQYCHGGQCTLSGPSATSACKCRVGDEAQMLVCRVVLGDYLLENVYRGNAPGQYWHGRRKEPEKTARQGGGIYNSVVGESKTNYGPRAGLNLREYIVYEASQIYPEYVVYYKRKK